MAANTASKAATPRPINLTQSVGYRGVIFGTTAGQFAAGSAYGIQAQGTAGVTYWGIPDNQAAALVIQEAANAYITLVTTNSSEAVKISKTLDVDGAFDFDGATFDVVSAGAFSIDGTGASNVSATAGNLTLSTITSGDVIITSAGGTIEMDDLVKLDAAGGAAAAGALLMGIGTSGSPATTAAADKNMVEIRAQSTATSGDFRNIYLRTDIAGAGGAGESLRANTVINAAAAGTVNGSHSTAEIKAAGGSVTGAAHGARNQLTVPNETQTGGTVDAAYSEVYVGGTSFVNNFTDLVIHRFGAAGADAATRNAQIKTLFGVDGFTTTSGGLFYANAGTAGAKAASLQIEVAGTAYWIWLYDAEA